MKIVILDGYTENPGDLSWAQLEALGELTVYDRTPSDEDEIIRRIGDAEIVMTNKTPLSEKVLNACTNIKYITMKLDENERSTQIRLMKVKDMMLKEAHHYEY